MGHEFYQIMVGAPTMSLYSWKQLARWSIDYSCLLKEDQAKGHNYFDQSWEEFCQAVVDKYDNLLMVGDKVDAGKAAMAYPPRKKTPQVY
jgi:adenosine deaminase CECR1